MIYLDNAATSFPKSESVYQEMDRVNRTLSVNSGRGSYKAAKEASEIIAATREKLLELFDAKGIADVILTPSITHAINQVLYGLELKNDSVVYLTPYEHNAVARCIHVVVAAEQVLSVLYRQRKKNTLWVNGYVYVLMDIM